MQKKKKQKRKVVSQSRRMGEVCAARLLCFHELELGFVLEIEIDGIVRHVVMILGGLRELS